VGVNRRILAVLGAAQFLMVLDTAVMNVSISTLVDDFDTEVTRIQGVITFYALVMAASMITGGRLGDRWGRRRAFTIGMAVYAVGSGLTAVSWSVPVLAIGWSVIEGLGAALVLPSLVALVAGSFTGRDRAAAYGVIGGIAGAGVAVGPIVGGWTTTYLSWRVVFAAEVVIALAILAGTRFLPGGRPTQRQPRLDLVGAALSAAGLALLVFGVLQGGAWGWVEPKGSAPTLFGLPLTPYLILLGLVVLGLFARWERRVERRGEQPLVHLDLFRVTQLRAGLSMLLAQSLILMGVFFAIPLYLQIVQGYDAFQTGLRMLPVSVTLFLGSASGPLISARWSPRTIARAGLVLLFAAIVGLLSLVEPELDQAPFLAALGVLGLGVGLISSQLGNVIQSSVDEDSRSEAGGLQYTAQNLGNALGTALIGAVVIGALASSFATLVAQDPEVSAEVKQQLQVDLDAGIQFIPPDQAADAATAAGIPADEVDQLVESYSDAQLQGLRVGFLVAGAIVVAASFLTRRLPDEPMVRADGDPAAGGSGDGPGTGEGAPQALAPGGQVGGAGQPQ
jgi:EmrB/QacA subfamily drug resistance transporter